ncbi:MAG: DUF2306 domain-containing protein [Pseudomonadota bacterium]
MKPVLTPVFTTAMDRIRKLPIPFLHKKPSGPFDAKSGFDISSPARTLVWAVGIGLTLAVLIAVVRGLTGWAPSHSNARDIAIAIHVTVVLPAIPLGAYLLLSRKGTKGHKQLGKLWVALMVATAVSAIFIRTGGSFSFIHIFVPITLIASYKVVATARRGDMQGHRSEVLSLYLGALTIPGVVSLLLPGRLMNVWLFW